MISRKIIESEIWNKPPLYLKVWIYLLMKAQHQKYKGLKRGQLRTSIPEIQEACTYYVGFRKVTPSKKEVWSVIDFLRSTQNGNISRNPYEENAKGNNEGNMIETTKATQGLLVTICNYNVYQDPKHYEGNAESPHEWNNEKDMKGTAGEQYKGRRYKNDKNVSDTDARAREGYDWEIESILAYLNDKTGKKYKRTASNRRIISDRLEAEGRRQPVRQMAQGSREEPVPRSCSALRRGQDRTVPEQSACRAEGKRHRLQEDSGEDPEGILAHAPLEKRSRCRSLREVYRHQGKTDRTYG